MRILYVTELWTALSGLLLSGDTVYKGMPAFIRVLQRFVEDGNEIDMLICETDPEKYQMPIAPQIDWLKKIHYQRCFLRHNYYGIRKPISELLKTVAVYQAAKKMIQQEHYDFVYGHGPFSEAAGVAAARHHIPFGQRRYGDSYHDYIQRFGMLKAFCSQPENYWSYRRKKDFMIATNDGSHIDLVYQKLNLGEKPYPLYFWRNGYEPVSFEEDKVSSLPDVELPYLLYVARWTSENKQGMGVSLLS